VSASRLLQSALWYAAHGWYVIPLHTPLFNATDSQGLPTGCTCEEWRRHDPKNTKRNPEYTCATPGKHPRLGDWEGRATTDETQLRKWWRAWPNANIGIAAGKSGLVCLDLDLYQEGAGDMALTRDEQETVTNLTGGGGQHLIYKHPDGPEITNSDGDLPDWVNVRAHGGQFVAPPSIHPSSNRYEWETEYGPHERDAASLPESLRTLLQGAAGDKQARFSLPEEKVTKGKRHQTLLSAAGSMRAKGFSQPAIEAALLAVNETQLEEPKPVDEVLALAEWAAKKEAGPLPGTNGHHTEEPDTLPQPEIAGDYGHARVLSVVLRDRFRYARHRAAWLRYLDGRWQPADSAEVAKTGSEELRELYAAWLTAATDKDTFKARAAYAGQVYQQARMAAALFFLRGWPGFMTEPDQWDADAWLLNVANGVLDLRNGELLPHLPQYLLTKQAPVSYDPTATGTYWLKHVERFLPDPDIRRQVQRDLGLALVGAPLEESLPIWYGVGANGKSTTARVVLSVLGDYGIMAAPELLLVQKNAEHQTQVADLVGRRLVFAAEADDGRRLATARVKNLTGGDTKKARFMYGDYFEFDQTFSIVLFVNHRPVITDTSDGMWRRIRLIPWTYQIPEGERLPQEGVVAALLTEAPAILNWLLEGLQDWRRDPHWVAPAVVAATTAYRQEQDRLGGFLGDCCELGPFFTAAVADVYARYEQHCKDEGEEAVNKSTFGKLLRDRGLSTKRVTGGARAWQGLRLMKE
jgi:putative DNA primase/helicase